MRELLVVGAVAFAFGAGGGWKLASLHYGKQIATLERDHAIASEAAQAQARERETELRRQLKEVERQADENRKSLEADLANARHAASRLRGELDKIRAESARSGAGTTGECEAARATSGMLAELFGELNEMAGIYAEAADRARLAGLTCEQSYQAVASP